MMFLSILTLFWWAYDTDVEGSEGLYLAEPIPEPHRLLPPLFSSLGCLTAKWPRVSQTGGPLEGKEAANYVTGTG